VPTLNDSQVLEFCKTGYLLLEAVVPERANRLTVEYCGCQLDFYEPTGLLQQDWFVGQVFLNPSAGGVVRSLLGRYFHLPVSIVNHRVIAPFPSGGWHIDGNFKVSHELNNLQVFYYPQETPLDLGPMQVLPGSHLVRNQSRFMAHF